MVLAVSMISRPFQWFSGRFAGFFVVRGDWLTISVMPGLLGSFRAVFGDFWAVSALRWPFGAVPVISSHFGTFVLRFGGFPVLSCLVFRIHFCARVPAW